MGKIKEELVTFGKAELTASCASVVDFGLAFFLSDIIGIYYGLANALGVISGGITCMCSTDSMARMPMSLLPCRACMLPICSSPRFML